MIFQNYSIDNRRVCVYNWWLQLQVSGSKKEETAPLYIAKDVIIKATYSDVVIKSLDSSYYEQSDLWCVAFILCYYCDKLVFSEYWSYWIVV